VSPIVLRQEDPPRDVVVIVRGGLSTAAGVRESAADAFEEFGIYAVSVFLALDEPIEVLCGTSGSSVATSGSGVPLGRVRAAGFALLLTLDRPHYDVVLRDLTDATLDRLDSSFDPPEPNPGVLPPPSAGKSQA
jgi:hypothetical protein